MKWRILLSSGPGQGDFKPTDEVFDDGQAGWDSFDPSVLQAHLDELGPAYGAELETDVVAP